MTGKAGVMLIKASKLASAFAYNTMQLSALSPTSSTAVVGET